MTTHNERGIALILALFLMAAMSVIGVSLMFLSQTETYASMNYRMMSQSRYAAEAGINKAAHFLLDSTQYTAPGTNPADPTSAYDMTKSPVRWGGQPVVLSSDVAQSNYPIAGVVTAFSAAAQGTLAAGTLPTITLTYKATATLLSMQQFDSYAGTPAVIQTWQITGTGGLQNSTKATVEVIAMVETPKVPASSYAAFATANTCGALTFSGNVELNSYDSTNMDIDDPPTLEDEQADVGTNGNLALGGSATVYGNLYTPRTGVGACTAGNVTALTETGSPDIAGSIVQLPKAVVYPTPAIPAFSPTGLAHLTSADSAACAALGLTYGALDATTKKPISPATCGASGDYLVLDGHGATLSLPEVELAGHTKITLVAGDPPSQYNFNSIDIASQSSISTLTTAQGQAAIAMVVGKDSTGVALAKPIDITGGGFDGVNSCPGCNTLCPSCSAFDATTLQFVYGGTGLIKMKGNAGAAASFYAPNASIDYGGTSDLFGSIIGKTIIESGSGNIHYDRRLQSTYFVAGQPMVGTFTWRRF